MDSPFRSWYQKPASQRRSYSYNPSPFGVPIYPVDPTRETRHSAFVDRQPPVEQKSGRKVVQIPVQFLGSDFSDSDRCSESALRIQNVLRGFLVRKSVMKIKEIKSQVDEIEARLLRNEVVEMIRRNERERLRMSEGLMNLLLKLDGIRGIDSGIRACRKGVTRKVIALQDKIDAICAPDSEGNGDGKVEIGNQELEDGVPVEIELSPENVAAAELESSQFENSENSDDFEQTLDDSGEESKGLNSVVRESENMEVERDAVHTELDAVVASEVNQSEQTLVETSKNIDFNEDNVDSVKEMLVWNIGKDKINWEQKENDAMGNCEFLANSDIGEMLCDLKEIHEVGKDVLVENETMEVERNHLDSELVDVPVTSVVEVTREIVPVKGTCEKLDFDEGNAETLKEMLAYSDDHGEILSVLNEEYEGNSLKVQGETMEVEKDHLDAESIDVSVAAGKAGQETQAMKETPENLDPDVDGAGTMKEMVVGTSGEDTAVVEKENLDKRKCELLEQMMEQNKKMMLMMTQLHKRNEMHLQMLDALTNRVELLEKAYLCDKLRNRRKKMKKNKCTLTCIED